MFLRATDDIVESQNYPRQIAGLECWYNSKNIFMLVYKRTKNKLELNSYLKSGTKPERYHCVPIHLRPHIKYGHDQWNHQ